jgi:hypothetical protein
MGMTHQVRIAASVQESLESLESLAARGVKTIPLPGPAHFLSVPYSEVGLGAGCSLAVIG